MDFQQVVEHRRSVRKFADTLVSKDVLQRIVETALKAPSSRNSRSTRFLIIRNSELVHRIAGMRDYGAIPLTVAPVAIVVMGDMTASDLWVENAAISATYLQLAIVDAGLKSCWIHVNGRPCMKEQPNGTQAIDYLRSLLPIPENYGVLCIVALGYSEFEPKPLPEDTRIEEKITWIV
jgi:nitroreductase